MSGTIYSSDLYQEKGELIALEQRLVLIEAAIQKNTVAARDMLKTLTGLNTSNKGGQSALKQLAIDAQKLQIANEKLAQEQIRTQLAQTRLTAAQTKASTPVVKLTREQQALNKLNAAAKGSYDALSAAMALNLIKLHALGDAEGVNRVHAQKLTETIAKQRAELIRLDATTGTHVRNVGNYLGAITSGTKNFLAQIFGISGAVSLAVKAFGDIKDTVVEFDTALTDLGNDTNLSGKALDDLGKAAIDLSGKYGTSAKELLSIFQLLINSNPELKDNIKLLKEVAEQVDFLSKAEKVSAEIASGAVTTARAKFNLSLEDSAKIVDTLASASDNGLAKLEKLSEAVSEGGDIAHQAGFDLKGYTDVVEAMAAVSKGGNIEAGKLSKVLLTLSKTGRDDLNPALHPLPEILRTISKETGIATGSTDALQKVSAIFGPKAAALAISLINQADAIEKLNNKQVEYNAALGDANANTQTLTGRTSEFSAEFHKTVLEVESGKGTFSEFLKVVVDLGIEIIKTARNFGHDLPIIITRLTSLGLIRGGLLAQEKEAIEQQKDFAKGQFELLDQTDELTKATTKQSDSIVKSNDSINKEIDSIDELNTKIKELTDKKNASHDPLEIKELTKQIDALEKKLGKGSKASTSVEQFATGTIGFLNERIADLNKALQNTTSETVITATTKQIDLLKGKVAEIQAVIDSANEKLKREKDGAPAPLAKLPTLGEGKVLGVSKPILTSSQSQKDIDDAKKKINEINEATFVSDQQYQAKIFDLEKHTELEKNEFKIQQEIDFIKHKIELNALGVEKISDKELAQNQQTLALLEGQKADLKTPVKKETDLFSLLGIDISDDKKQAVTAAVEFAKNQLQSLFDFQNKLDQQRIDASNNRVQNAQTNLDRELQFLRDGQANKAGIAQKELNEAKKQQAESLKLQQKHQKAQLVINSALEASNLFVASAKILAEFPIAGPFLVAGMIGSFIAAKAAAFAAVNKQTFREGDLEFADGVGTHESGKDKYIGHDNKGRPKYMETGEAQTVINAYGVKKTGRTELRSIFDAIQKGEFHDRYKRVEREANSLPSLTNILNVNTSIMENELSAIRKQGESRSYVDGAGRLVTIRGNRTTINE